MSCTRAALAILILFGPAGVFAQIRAARDAQAPPPQNLVQIDASQPSAPPETGFLHLGGRSSTGHDLEVNSRFLTLDGKPMLPVMGEFHFSRYPPQYWEDEILKMKAAGVNVIATYIFWIHHEEIEGEFDWTGSATCVISWNSAPNTACMSMCAPVPGITAKVAMVACRTGF